MHTVARHGKKKKRKKKMIHDITIYLIEKANHDSTPNLIMVQTDMGEKKKKKYHNNDLKKIEPTANS